MSTSLLAAPKAAQAASSTQLNRIVAFVTDDISEAALRTGLAGLPNELVLKRGNIRQAIRFLEKDSDLQAVIVDVTGTEDPLAALEHLSQVCPPNVVVAVVGDAVDIAFYRLLVNEIGVVEYMPKPLTRDLVERLLPRHFAPDQAHQPGTRGGHVIAVCGASGGAGASTIAVSTAIELAEVVKGNVALLDLNLQHGATALMLGARPGPGLRIALEDPDQADALLLERTAIQLGPRLRLIAADEALGSGISITEPGARQVLSLVRQKFNFVVVDLPMPLRPELHQVLTLARHVVVVMAPDVASARNARAIRQLAMTLAGADRVVPMVNRSDMKGGLSSTMLEKALGSPSRVSVPELGRRMPEAVNLGIPAIRRVPDLRKHLAPLIQEIAAIHGIKSSESWIRRLLRK
ncbi:MAG TPA: pilus assembly protein CpaE [Acetobacteraceae bacterium]|jgi:pilus assembly protein CpaE|nr:pilus assembly protein CpaE [Acetobacteraceae bacterium]